MIDKLVVEIDILDQAKALPLKDRAVYLEKTDHILKQPRNMIYSYLLGNYKDLSDAIENFNNHDSDFDVPSFQKACSSIAYTFNFFNINLFNMQDRQILTEDQTYV